MSRVVVRQQTGNPRVSMKVDFRAEALPTAGQSAVACASQTIAEALQSHRVHCANHVALCKESSVWIPRCRRRKRGGAYTGKLAPSSAARAFRKTPSPAHIRADNAARIEHNYRSCTKNTLHCHNAVFTRLGFSNQQISMNSSTTRRRSASPRFFP